MDRSRVELSAGVGSRHARCRRDGVELPAGVVVAAGEQEQVGVAGADDAGRTQHAVGRHLAGRRDAAGRDVDATDREDGVVLDQGGQGGDGGRLGGQGGQGGRGQRGRLEERLGQAGPAGLLEHPDQVDVAQAQPTDGRGHHERGRTEFGQDGPAVGGLLGPAERVGQLEGAQRVDVALGVEHGAHALTQLVLLLGESEIHRSTPQRGRPSKRSPTTLRWISLVPA